MSDDDDLSEIEAEREERDEERWAPARRPVRGARIARMGAAVPFGAPPKKPQSGALRPILPPWWRCGAILPLGAGCRRSTASWTGSLRSTPRPCAARASMSTGSACDRIGRETCGRRKARCR